MYGVTRDGLISSGFDVPEPIVKAGSLNLAILSTANKIIQEPQRLIAGIFWAFYCWLLFISDIAPGLNALSLDAFTWAEVRDLSLNFWLVLPILSPSTAPVRHPLLEATFNLVLAWAGLFVGFLIDGRAKGRNGEQGNTMVPTVIGMQLLTNAIYLPYLVTRDVEKGETEMNYSYESLTPLESVAESKILPFTLLSVGALAISWGLTGRADAYPDLDGRVASYWSLLQSDRLTFSFLVDLAYFAIFQGWLVEADLNRRLPAAETQSSRGILAAMVKFVPFAGLAAYLLLRPPLPFPPTAASDSESQAKIR